MEFTMEGPELLHYIIQHKKRYYRTFTIPKKSGGYRLITAPNDELKAIQREILDKILKHIPCHNACHSFIEKRGIKTNAEKHLGKPVCVVNLDLKDFFPSCKKEMVIEFLKKHVSTPHAIAELICYNESLPQGTPTSPYMSNLLGYELDKKLTNLAYKHKARYTRYADDLTFSSKTNKNLHEIIPKVHSFIKRQNFVLNYKKIHVTRRGGRQMVTGLVVNDRLNVSRSRVRNFRAEVHQTSLDGSGDDFKEYNKLMGFSSFIFLGNKKKGAKFYKKIQRIFDGTRK